MRNVPQIVMAGLFTIFLLSSHAQAGTVWDGDGGAGSASWADPLNWGGSTPVYGGSTVIDFDVASGFTSGTSTTMIADRLMLELQIGTPTSFSIGTSSETLQLTNLNHQSTTGTGQHTIDANIELQANGTWTMAGSSGTRMRLNGVISDGGNNYSINLTTLGGNRFLRLEGANTYGGGTTINAATLELGNSSVFGSGPITFNNAVKLGSVGGSLNFTNNVEFAGTMSFGFSSNPAITFSGPIELSNNVGLSNTGQSASGLVTLDGDITESGGSRSLSLTFGNRTVVLNGDNSYTGGTTLSAAAATQTTTLEVGHNNALGSGTLTLGSPGNNIIRSGVNGIVLGNDVDLSLDATKTLQIGGNGNTITLNGIWSGTGGDVTVASGGTLGGTGAITGDVTFNSGSTLAPGASPGVLGMAGAVVMTTGVTFDVELEGIVAGTEYDQLQLTSGSINLGDATLQITHNDFFGGQPEVMLGIIDNAPAVTLLGEFSGLSNGDLVDTIDGRDYHIYYNADFSTLSLTGGNDVVLFAEALPVPEPSSLVLFCGGLLGLLARRKRLTSCRSQIANRRVKCPHSTTEIGPKGAL